MTSRWFRQFCSGRNSRDAHPSLGKCRRPTAPLDRVMVPDRSKGPGQRCSAAADEGPGPTAPHRSILQLSLQQPWWRRRESNPGPRARLTRPLRV